VRPSLTFWLLALGIPIATYLALRPHVGNGHGGRHLFARIDINGSIKTALNNYREDNGVYPGSLQELVQKSETDKATNWHGPYLGRMPIDPWANAYVYLFPGKHNATAYDLFSAGPDGRIGTEDDIGNWTK
jgi:general secretion pathway protein G